MTANIIPSSYGGSISMLYFYFYCWCCCSILFTSSFHTSSPLFHSKTFSSSSTSRTATVLTWKSTFKANSPPSPLTLLYNSLGQKTERQNEEKIEKEKEAKKNNFFIKNDDDNDANRKKSKKAIKAFTTLSQGGGDNMSLLPISFIKTLKVMFKDKEVLSLPTEDILNKAVKYLERGSADIVVGKQEDKVEKESLSRDSVKALDDTHQIKVSNEEVTPLKENEEVENIADKASKFLEQRFAAFVNGKNSKSKDRAPYRWEINKDHKDKAPELGEKYALTFDAGFEANMTGNNAPPKYEPPKPKEPAPTVDAGAGASYLNTMAGNDAPPKYEPPKPKEPAPTVDAGAGAKMAGNDAPPKYEPPKPKEPAPTVDAGFGTNVIKLFQRIDPGFGANMAGNNTSAKYEPPKPKEHAPTVDAGTGTKMISNDAPPKYESKKPKAPVPTDDAGFGGNIFKLFQQIDAGFGGKMAGDNAPPKYEPPKPKEPAPIFNVGDDKIEKEILSQGRRDALDTNNQTKVSNRDDILSNENEQVSNTEQNDMLIRLEKEYESKLMQAEVTYNKSLMQMKEENELRTNTVEQLKKSHEEEIESIKKAPAVNEDEILSNVAKEYDLNLMEVKTSYEESLTQGRNEIESLSKMIEELKKTHAQEIRAIHETMERDRESEMLRNIQLEYDSKLMEAEASYNESLTKEREEKESLNEMINKLTTSHSEEIDLLQTEHIGFIQDLKSQAEEDMLYTSKAAMEQEFMLAMQEKEAAHDANVQSLLAEAETNMKGSTLQQMETIKTYKEEVRRLKDAYFEMERALDSAARDHSLEKENSIRDFEREVETIMTRMKDEHNQELESLRSELSESYEANIARSKKEIGIETKAMYEELMKSSEENIMSQYGQSNQDYAEEISNIIATSNKEKEELERELKYVHEIESERLVSQLEKAETYIKSEEETKNQAKLILSNLKNDYDALKAIATQNDISSKNTIDQLTNNYEQTIAHLDVRLKSFGAIAMEEKAELNAQHERQMQFVVEEHQNEVYKLRKSLETQGEEINTNVREEYEKELQRLKSELQKKDQVVLNLARWWN